MSEIKLIEWKQILEIWCNKLWVGRESKIKPTNGLKFMGGYDKEIEKNTPTFFGAYEDNKLVGVNSGFETGNLYYRSRGLYVDPYYRRQGIATSLLRSVEDQAIFQGCKILWSIPRKTALSAYTKAGFIRVSPFFDEAMEFGPNCYAVKNIGEN
jgi:GNAT superfamily N-acetyltransferase